MVRTLRKRWASDTSLSGMASDAGAPRNSLGS